MLNAAVIGVGSIGQHHARNYADLPGVQLVAVADASEPLAERIGHRYNAPFETDYRTLLDTYKPDLVSVAVPTNLHFEVAQEAIKRGIHVLVEKPITETVAQAQALIALAKQHNVRLMVGHIERFNPAVMELKKRLAAGALGKVFRLQSRRMGPFPARIRDVGVVIDLASHDLDMVRHVLGTEVTRLFAETAQGINTDREDIMDCVLRCENGVIGTLNVNWMTPAKVRELMLIGSQGMFLVNYLTQELYFYENDAAPSEWHQLSVLTGVGEGNMTLLKIPRHEPLRAELQEFISAVQEAREPLVTGEDGMKALALAQAVVQSGNEGRMVEGPRLNGGA